MGEGERWSPITSVSQYSQTPELRDMLSQSHSTAVHGTQYPLHSIQPGMALSLLTSGHFFFQEEPTLTTYSGASHLCPTPQLFPNEEFTFGFLKLVRVT